MEHVEIFMLLPVYEETVGQPGYLRRVGVLGDDEYRVYIDAVNKIKSFFCYERFNGYYDSQNVKAFAIPIDTLQDCYPRMSVLLRKALMDWGSDWRRKMSMTEADETVYFNEAVKGDTLCEVAKRQTSDHGSSFLLLDCDAFVHKADRREVVFNGVDVSLSTCGMNEQDLAEWFSCNRKPARVFHLSPKHGEKGKGAYPENKGDEVSSLQCSEDDARELLKRAVGVDEECKRLHYYDSENGMFVEFKCEGGGVYHGFHIKNEQAGIRVPADVKRKIWFLLKRQA